MDEETRELWRKIQHARKHITKVQNARAMLAGAVAGALGIVRIDVEFPDPDAAHVFQCAASGHRLGDPIVYRLSLKTYTWIGVSHPWGPGFKPADIPIPDDAVQI